MEISVNTADPSLEFQPELIYTIPNQTITVNAGLQAAFGSVNLMANLDLIGGIPDGTYELIPKNHCLIPDFGSTICSNSNIAIYGYKIIIGGNNIIHYPPELPENWGKPKVVVKRILIPIQEEITIYSLLLMAAFAKYLEMKYRKYK